MDRSRQDILYEHVTPPPRHRPPLADPAGPGEFFAEEVHLPAGRHAARVQVMLAPEPPAGADITVTLSGQEGERARLRWRLDPARPEQADHLMLSFALGKPGPVRIACAASTRAGEFRLRAVKIQQARHGGPLDWSTTHGTLDLWPLDRIR